jgi:hypothetical protein
MASKWAPELPSTVGSTRHLPLKTKIARPPLNVESAVC